LFACRFECGVWLFFATRESLFGLHVEDPYAGVPLRGAIAVGLLYGLFIPISILRRVALTFFPLVIEFRTLDVTYMIVYYKSCITKNTGRYK